MKTLSSHINAARFLLTAALLPALVLCAARPASSAAAQGGYGWPVAPFDRQHPVRGTFGDPRTVFQGPPTFATLYHGGGSFSFHMGVDICAADGTAVYPVADGVVCAVNSQKVVVDSGGGNRFEYWHIRAAVRVGQRVSKRSTVLGRILRGSGHVHLTEISGGHVTNPLLPGHLTPYEDTTPPAIDGIRLVEREDAPALMPGFVRGRIEIVVQAHDTPTLRVPKPWHDMPTTPNLITWRLDTWNGKHVVPRRVVWDTRRTMPDNATFWRHYARGTYQNMSVFAPHYSWGQPGIYLFRIATLDTRHLKDSVYRLVVTAADVAGNRTQTWQVVSVHNAPGWVGV